MGGKGKEVQWRQGCIDLSMIYVQVQRQGKIPSEQWTDT
jgi:hypothetical protein